MPRDEVSDFLAFPEAMHLGLGLPSRRTLFWLAFLLAPVVRASRSHARDQPAPSQQLVKASVANLLLWKPEWEVGEALVGQFTAKNSGALSPQNGSVNLILYDASGQVENSVPVSVFIPLKAEIDIVFVSGPAAKVVGPKVLELRSASNAIKTNLAAKPAPQSISRKDDLSNGGKPKDGGCWPIAIALGMCR